ncbi:MAG: hemerythrin family protein [Myxococcales bacterium]|nr:hemerythrin family protein [Myxococcales bacterium]MBK7198966.1 hemerythrin family protein [Myxococcales bacterium]
MLMEWGPKLSVGIQSFDAEHQKLVAMVNDLFDAINTGKGKEKLGVVLGALIDYTVTHFQHEEREMKAHNFPAFAKHKEEHDALTKQVAEVRQKFAAGNNAALSAEVMAFLKNWLIKHIMGTDKGYTAFLVSKGVK